MGGTVAGRLHWTTYMFVQEVICQAKLIITRSTGPDVRSRIG